MLVKLLSKFFISLYRTIGMKVLHNSLPMYDFMQNIVTHVTFEELYFTRTVLGNLDIHVLYVWAKLRVKLNISCKLYVYVCTL